MVGEERDGGRERGRKGVKREAKLVRKMYRKKIMRGDGEGGRRKRENQERRDVKGETEAVKDRGMNVKDSNAWQFHPCTEKRISQITKCRTTSWEINCIPDLWTEWGRLWHFDIFHIMIFIYYYTLDSYNENIFTIIPPHVPAVHSKMY